MSQTLKKINAVLRNAKRVVGVEMIFYFCAVFVQNKDDGREMKRIFRVTVGFAVMLMGLAAAVTWIIVRGAN